VFRDNAVEREQLATTRREANQQREQRGKMIASLISRFDQSVQSMLGKVRGASEQLGHAAHTLNQAANRASAEARLAESRVETASRSVSASAASTEQLTESIGHIANLALKSTKIVACAVSEAESTVQIMSGLDEAAGRIGKVVGLIQ